MSMSVVADRDVAASMVHGAWAHGIGESCPFFPGDAIDFLNLVRSHLPCTHSIIIVIVIFISEGTQYIRDARTYSA